MDKELAIILAAHPSLKIINDGTRIQCDFTGHQLPMRADPVRQYVSSRRYKRLFDLQQSPDYEKYKLYLVPSTRKGNEHMLFCTITALHVNNGRKFMEDHFAGRKFKREFERYLYCQKTGEKFITKRSKKPRKRKSDEDEDEQVRPKRKGQICSKRKLRKGDHDDEDENDDVDKDDVSDTLSDLYPAADFERLDLNEGSDYEFEDMEDGSAAEGCRTQSRVKNCVQSEKSKKRPTTQKKPKFVKENKAKKLKT